MRVATLTICESRHRRTLSPTASPPIPPFAPLSPTASPPIPPFAPLSEQDIVDAVEKLLARYLSIRESPEERFIECVRRVGLDRFREAVYGPTLAAAAG